MFDSIRKKFISIVLFTLIFSMSVFSAISVNGATMRAVSSGLDTSKSDDNMSNLVIYVNFKDTIHNHYSSYWGKCFLEDPNLETLFYGDKNSLRQYIYDITYGAVKVANLFPQYDASTKKIAAVTLPHNTNYYTSGYSSTSTNIVEDAVNELINQGRIPSSYNLDRNNDGVIDNITVIVPCESSNSNTALYGLSAYYTGSLRVNNKRVGSYNIITESGAYLSNGQSGLLIHEFMHVLGYKDLYRSGTDVSPVGVWDIMSSESAWLQAPLAYQRMKISNAFSINTVTTNQTGYRLSSVYSGLKANASSSVKNNQAVILKTPYSDNEFFVIEYRQKQSDSNAYERMIYGSGIIIYRVNTSTQYKENKGSGPYYIYVFRQNDTYTNGVETASKEKMSTSYLSAESGRTSYGQASPSMSLSDNAITYSDGTNSGIVIKNVASASGDTITFDIEFHYSATDLWDTVSTDNLTNSILQMDTTIGANGTIYAAVNYYNGSSENPALYTINGSTWTKVATLPSGSDYHISEHGGKLYLLYCGTDYKAHLCVLNGNSWSNDLYKSTEEWSDASMVSSSDGLYISVCYSTGVETLRYTASAQSMGTITGCNYPCNAKISVVGSTPYLVLRDAFNGNTIKTYQHNGTSWTLVDSSRSAAGYNGIDSIAIDNSLYLLDDGKSLYQYNNGWTKVGSNLASDSSMYYSMAEGNNHSLYISYMPSTGNSVMTVQLKNSSWEKVGENVTNNNALQWLKLSKYGDNLFVSYLENANGNATVKKHEIAATVCSHSFVTTKNPCHEDGIKKCSLCGYTELLPANENFSAETRNQSAKYSGDVYCKTCNQLVMKGHSISVGETPTEAQTTAAQSTTAKTTAAQTTTAKTTAAQTTTAKTTAAQNTTAKTTATQTTAAKTSAAQTTTSKTSANQNTIDNTTITQTTIASSSTTNTNDFVTPATSAETTDEQTMSQEADSSQAASDHDQSSAEQTSYSNTIDIESERVGESSGEGYFDEESIQEVSDDASDTKTFPYWIIIVSVSAIFVGTLLFLYIFLRRKTHHNTEN